LLGIEGGIVRLRVQVTGHACGSTGNSLKAMVEDALYEAAPDMGRLVLEELEEPAGSSGFVPLGKLSSVATASVQE